MQLLKNLVGLRPPSPHWFSSTSHYGCTDAHCVEMTYLGTAGFVIQNAMRTVVLDPYLTRTPLPSLLTSPLEPDAALVKRIIPSVDDVLVGHAHYDHILDAPILCQQTGARLIGSSSTIMVGRAAGLPEPQLLETRGREDIPSGDWIIRGLPSVHGKILGRIPMPGDIETPPRWPPRMHELKHGLVLNWLLETPGLRIMHIDSADFITAELAHQRADVVCLCAIGRSYRPNYVKEVVNLLKPRWIVPCHWDTMMTPLESTPEMIPGVDIPGFINEIRAAGVEPVMLPILGKARFGSRN